MVERLKTLMIAALLTALAGSIALAATGGEAEVRINARQLEDGRVEFALQQRVDGEWGERQLPRSRYFPADVGHNRWLNSTPMTVSVVSVEAAESPAAEPQPAAAEPSGGYTPILIEHNTVWEDADDLPYRVTSYWSAVGSFGHRTFVTRWERSNYGLYRIARLSLFCDHDNPDAVLWGTVDLVPEHDYETRKGLDEDGTPRWRAGRAYSDNAVHGEGWTRADDLVEFEFARGDLEGRRWFWVSIPVWDGEVQVTCDLSSIRATPAWPNLANCGS